MSQKLSEFFRVKEKYLKFVKSQEILGDTFKDKIGQLNNFYFPICEMIYKDYLKNKKTKIIGLAGGQGSGKSTISQILKIILKERYNLNVVTLSIDDFYKTLKDRVKMSKKISKLFLTRGVPGTHDTKMLFNCLNKLKKNSFNQILVPKFDKSLDDRCKKNKWIKISKKPDVVVFEGWCIGANAQGKNSLIKSINLLERREDQKQIWRKKVNNELKSRYKKVFDLIDTIVFLKIPSFKYVYKWRLLQERKLKKTSKGRKIMNPKQLKKFIMFYERITRHMLKTLDAKSKVVLNIDTNHRFKSIKFN